MQVPYAILNAIAWFCHHIVRLTHCVQQKQSAQLTRAAFAIKTKPWKWIYYKLLKSFFFVLSGKKTGHHSCGVSTSSKQDSQQLSSVLSWGPYRTVQAKPKRTGGQTDWESVNAGSHIAAFGRIQVLTERRLGSGVDRKKTFEAEEGGEDKMFLLCVRCSNRAIFFRLVYYVQVMQTGGKQPFIRSSSHLVFCWSGFALCWVSNTGVVVWSIDCCRDDVLCVWGKMKSDKVCRLELPRVPQYIHSAGCGEGYVYPRVGICVCM